MRDLKRENHKRVEFTKEELAEFRKLEFALLDEHGREILNPDPMTVDVTPEVERLHEQVQKILKTELAKQEWRARGIESPEEAEDFHIPEEDEPVSPHEMPDEGTIPEMIPEPGPDLGPGEAIDPANTGGSQEDLADTASPGEEIVENTQDPPTT